MTTLFAPVFSKDGHEFIVTESAFVADNEQTAREIGLGAMLVECIILGMAYTKRTLEFDPENTPHIRAEIGPLVVAVISGPMFNSRDAALPLIDLPLRAFFFTVAANQPYGPGYVLVWARTWDDAREKMFEKFGRLWSFQYLSLEDVHPNDRRFIREIR